MQGQCKGYLSNAWAVQGLFQQRKGSVRSVSAMQGRCKGYLSSGRAALAMQVLLAVQSLTTAQVPQLIGIDSYPIPSKAVKPSNTSIRCGLAQTRQNLFVQTLWSSTKAYHQH